MDVQTDVSSEVFLAESRRAAESLVRAQASAAQPGSIGATAKEAAQKFESYMLKLLLQEMRKTVEKGGLFGDEKDNGYVSLLDSALADRAAEAGSFGLADQLLRQWEGRR